MIKYVDDAFSFSADMMSNQLEIDELEIRDSFLEFISAIMKNYTKYLITPD